MLNFSFVIEAGDLEPPRMMDDYDGFYDESDDGMIFAFH